ELPAILDELTEWVFGLGDGECGQGDGEPTVRRAQEDGPRLFVTVVVEMVQVRMPASTARQVLLPCLAEGLRHAARCLTGIALHPQVLGLQRGAALEEAQCPLAGAVAAVDEVVPGEVVEMAVAAGQQETRGNRIGVLRRLVALGTTTALVDEAGALRTEAVLLDLEQAGIERRQQAALHAAHPAWERAH